MTNLIHTIKFKVGIITSITILFFGLISCVLTYLFVYRQIANQIELDFTHIVKTSAQVIEHKLSSSTEVVKNLAADQDIIDYLLLDPDSRPQSQDRVTRQLSKYNLGNNYSAIYFTDKNGIALASTDPEFINQDYSFRQYFISAINGIPHADVNFGVTSQKLGYYFSSPITDSQSQIIGVAIVKLDPSVLNRPFDNMISTDTVDLMLVDRYGVIVFSTKPERIYHSLGQLDQSDRLKLIEEKKYSNIEIKPLQYQEAIGRIKSRPQQTIVLSLFDDVDGDYEKLFITPVKNTSFYLVSEVGSDHTALAAGSVALLISIMVGLAAIFTLLLLIISLSAQLRPITDLTTMATQISQGNFDITNLVNTKDELFTLGNVIHRMAISLRDKYSELETLVNERTKKLESQTRYLSRSQLAIENLLEDTSVAKQAAEIAVNDLQKYKRAVDNASDHIIITDPDGTILYANPAVTKLTGFSNREVVGKKAGNKTLWGGLMPPEFYKQLWQTIKKDKKTFVGEINNKRKNGQKYIALSSISPILDNTGKVIFFVGIERDATTAREVDRMKTEFVSFASHQLRTPLSAMKWFAEMLLAGDAGKLNKEQAEFVKNIYDSNERMVELVKDLLDISRIESGRIIIDPVPTDLEKLIKGILTEVTVRSNSKKQKVISIIKTKLPTVNLDPSLIRNVYLNLLNNAIKYTPEKGKITMTVTKKGKNILSEVSDNGFGIPLDQQEQTFQKFFRATNAIKKETEGTGLGLYLVKSVVESSGGKIWFKSTEGHGTTFWFTIPIAGVPRKKGQVRLSS